MKIITLSVTTVSGLAMLLTVETTLARQAYVSRIPNGSVNSCTTCHQEDLTLNSFGEAFLTADLAWTATLAGADADTDSFSNGQELGDPKGSGTPIANAQVTLPGDASSKPNLAPPVVGITSPAAGAVFPAPYTGPVTVMVDNPEAVNQVDFYAGDTLLGTVAAAPFSLAINLAAGNYMITAKATDYLGATGVSSAVSITVETSTSARPELWGSYDAANNTFVLQITGQPGSVYHIQTTDNLLTTQWTEVGTVTNDQAQAQFVHSIPANASNLYYRATSP